MEEAVISAILDPWNKMQQKSTPTPKVIDMFLLHLDSHPMPPIRTSNVLDPPPSLENSFFGFDHVCM
jgi:hypothetical protein